MSDEEKRPEDEGYIEDFVEWAKGKTVKKGGWLFFEGEETPRRVRLKNGVYFTVIDYMAESNIVWGVDESPFPDDLRHTHLAKARERFDKMDIVGARFHVLREHVDELRAPLEKLEAWMDENKEAFSLLDLNGRYISEDEEDSLDAFINDITPEHLKAALKAPGVEEPDIIEEALDGWQDKDDHARFIHILNLNLVDYIIIYNAVRHPEKLAGASYPTRKGQESVFSLVKPPSYPEIWIYKLDKHLFPVDKVNRNFLRQVEGADSNGQMQFTFDTGITDAQGETIPVLLNMDFSKLPEDIRAKLTPFDWRVMCAYASLMELQEKIAVKETGKPIKIDDYKPIKLMTICKSMGLKGSPLQLERVDKALDKMAFTKINLSNTQESQHSDYPIFEYEGYLLPIARVKASDNGEIIDGAIIPLLNGSTELTRQPAPLITFAHQRGQITRVTTEQLNSPLSLTDTNIAIEDYIIDRVKRYENTRFENGEVVKLDTLFDACGVTAKGQRTKLAEKIDRDLLPHYEETGLLTVTGKTYGTGRSKRLERFTFAPGRKKADAGINGNQL